MPLALIKPTTSSGKALRNLGYLVAHTDAFKDLVGAESNAEAEERVHEHLVSDQLNEAGEFIYPRPRAIVGMGGDYEYSKLSPGHYLHRYSLILSIESDVPEIYREEDAAGDMQIIEEWFAEKVGKIFEQMCELSETERNEVETYLVFDSLSIEQGPGEMLQEAGESFWAVVARVTVTGL